MASRKRFFHSCSFPFSRYGGCGRGLGGGKLSSVRRIRGIPKRPGMLLEQIWYINTHISSLISSLDEPPLKATLVSPFELHPLLALLSMHTRKGVIDDNCPLATYRSIITLRINVQRLAEASVHTTTILPVHAQWDMKELTTRSRCYTAFIGASHSRNPKVTRYTKPKNGRFLEPLRWSVTREAPALHASPASGPSHCKKLAVICGMVHPA